VATLGEFASLLQLGVGIGIGLSVFRAPMELRAAHVEKSLADELKVFNGLTTEKALTARGNLASLQLEFNDVRRGLEELHKPFMALTVAGALGNWTILALASLYSAYELSNAEAFWLLTLSIFYYVAIWVCLEVLTRWRLRNVQSKLCTLTDT
jgi:hypothetical protein